MVNKMQMTQSLATQGLSSADITRFRNKIRGEIVLPDDTEYDDARRVHNLVYDRHPALIVRPADADDVVSAVQFGSQMGLPIAVRGGGHSGSGLGTVDGGMVIDMSLMHAITVDADARIARAQGGITAGAYTAATISHGLVTPFGDSPSVGIGGLTLGGGTGWLTRKMGMTIDSLLSAELVTADGRKLRASETEHPDLFWAIRGGGGNFGIVTLFEFRLHPIDTVLGGFLYLPLTREVIRGIIDLSTQAPDELTMITLIMPIPPMPELSKELHGQLAVMVGLVWAGDLQAGESAIAPFRALAEPMADLIRPIPFTTMYEIMKPAGQPTRGINRAFLADSLDDSVIDTIISHLEERDPRASAGAAVVQLRVFGGAMVRIPADATAFAHRDAMLMVAIAVVGFEPAELDVQRAWVELAFGAMRHISTGAYLNFLEDDGAGRIGEAYPESTYLRLAAVKRRYDPNNLFHVNQNIEPAKSQTNLTPN